MVHEREEKDSVYERERKSVYVRKIERKIEIER